MAMDCPQEAGCTCPESKPWTRRRVIRVLLPALTGTALFPGVLAAKQYKCYACGEWITDRYIEVEGKYFHPECFRCASCGHVIDGAYAEKDGKFYHPDCYHEAFSPRCGWCGKPVTDTYVQKDGAVYHESCYVENLAPVCAISGEPILGAYITDWWGTTIRAEYEDQVERCDSCGRFALPGKAWRLSDGRIQCSECRKTEVTDAADARRITEEAIRILERKGIHIDVPIDRIRISLVDVPRLRELHGGKGGDPNGLHRVHTETMNGRVVRETTALYYLYGLPRDLLLGVAAHELFHVWQHENKADGGGPKWREGSANVAMRLVLEELDSDLARYHLENLEENEDPAYGKGYRKAWAYYRDHGMREFLEQVKKKGSGRRRE